MTHKRMIMTLSSPRITARVDEVTQELLSKAAALSGVSSINSFVLSAAVEKAKDIMRKEELLELSKSDALLLIEALDRPAKVHPKLKSTFDSYDTKKQ